jgi:thioredoxin 1
MNSIIYVIVGVIAIFLLMQLLVKFKGWQKRGKAAPEIDGPLGTAIKKGNKLIAYFYSPTCGACKTQEKYLPKLEGKTDNIYRINAARDAKIAAAFGIMGTPTTIIIKNGIIRNYFVGITPTKKLLDSLNN